MVYAYNDDPVKAKYEEGQKYRTTFEWYFAPGSGWNIPDHEGMREFHLSMAEKYEAMSTPLKPQQRIELDDDVWLVLESEEQDLPITDPLLVVRYLEGIAGVMRNAQYQTAAEAKAHSLGVAQRNEREGTTAGMPLFS